MTQIWSIQNVLQKSDIWEEVFHFLFHQCCRMLPENNAQPLSWLHRRVRRGQNLHLVSSMRHLGTGKNLGKQWGLKQEHISDGGATEGPQGSPATDGKPCTALQLLGEMKNPLSEAPLDDVWWQLRWAISAYIFGPIHLHALIGTPTWTLGCSNSTGSSHKERTVDLDSPEAQVCLPWWFFNVFYFCSPCLIELLKWMMSCSKLWDA